MAEISCVRVDRPAEPSRQEAIDRLLTEWRDDEIANHHLAMLIANGLTAWEADTPARTYWIEGELSAKDFDALAEFGRSPMPIPPLPDALSAILVAITERAYAEGGPAGEGLASAGHLTDIVDPYEEAKRRAGRVVVTDHGLSAEFMPSGAPMSDPAGATDSSREPKQEETVDGPPTDYDIGRGAFLQYVETGDECYIANMRPDEMRAVLQTLGDVRQSALPLPTLNRCPGHTVTAEELAEWRYGKVLRLASDHGLPGDSPWGLLEQAKRDVMVQSMAMMLAAFFPEHIAKTDAPTEEPQPPVTTQPFEVQDGETFRHRASGKKWVFRGAPPIITPWFMPAPSAEPDPTAEP